MDARIIPLAAINRPAERWVVAVGPNSSYLSSGSVLQLPSWEPAVSMASLQPEETCSSYWRQACDRLTSHSVTNTACHSQWMKPTKQPLVSTTQPVTDQTNWQTNQLINQRANQPTNRPTNKLMINQSNSQPTDRSTKQPNDRSTKMSQPAKQSKQPTS